MDFPSLTTIIESAAGGVREAAPQFLMAVVWLLAGWALAWVCSLLVKKFLESLSGRVEARIERIGSLRGLGFWRAAPDVIGRGFYWAIFLYFATAAIEKLSVPFAADILQTLAYFLPKVLLALVLVFAGAGLASLVHQWIFDIASKAGISNPGILGRISQAGILAVTLIVAVQQVGLEGSIFISMTAVVLGSTLGGMALAFGLGSGPVVTNIMASYYASRALGVGDSVRIGETEGTVREITSTSIVVDAGDDLVHLPARRYCDEACVVVGGNR